MKLAKFIWHRWLAIARVIGNFQAQVILSIVYLIILLPLGFVFRVFLDPLKMRSGRAARSNFQTWEHPKENLEEAKKQY